MKKNTGLKAALIAVCALLVVVGVLLVLLFTGVIGPNRGGGTGQAGASVTAGTSDTSGTLASDGTDTSGTGGTSEDAQTLYEVQVERHEEAYTLTDPDGQTETVFELNYEIRLADANTDFINELAEQNGIESAVLVSYNGDYMG